MRLISIEMKTGTQKVVVNTEQICCIRQDGDTVTLRLACGHAVTTKFTDVDHATDYIQRAASHSFVTA